ALAERLAAEDPGLAAPASSPARPTVATGPGDAFGEVGPPRGALDLPPAVTERRERTAFVGRHEELGRLTASLGAVAAGDRRLVVVQGEAGMGKTRLAQVFAHAVHDVGGHVLWGRCTAENLVAYQPAAEALRTALRAVSPERVRAIVAPRPALRLLLPEGTAPEGALDDGAGGRAASRTERYELYEGLAEVIGAVSLTGPVVFVVDDAQWADRSSLHLIEHLVRQDVSGRLLVLATVRRPAGRPTDDLDRLVADLRRDQRLDLVTVGGMGASDAVALLGDRGVDVDDLRADALVERTGGNPFFLESLAARGGDILALDDRDLPESVRDLIDLRLEGLDEEAARVLATAAVIGLRVELDVLELASGLGPDELLDQVDAALGSGVLVEDEELGWVTFPHALVRQALVARTTRNREAQLHLRVADAGLSGDAAWGWLQAGLAAEDHRDNVAAESYWLLVDCLGDTDVTLRHEARARIPVAGGDLAAARGEAVAALAVIDGRASLADAPDLRHRRDLCRRVESAAEDPISLATLGPELAGSARGLRRRGLPQRGRADRAGRPCAVGAVHRIHGATHLRTCAPGHRRSRRPSVCRLRRGTPLSRPSHPRSSSPKDRGWSAPVKRRKGLPRDGEPAPSRRRAPRCEFVSRTPIPPTSPPMRPCDGTTLWSPASICTMDRSPSPN
ncbi:MAG: AAA family ATPase, partial [Tetrasphaera sp.]|nr:AAA family ATPase [Tetrasphaera sp.]